MTSRHSLGPGALTLLAAGTLLFLAFAPAQAQHISLRLHFTASSPADSAATAEYQTIWASDGPQIVEAMEQRTGLQFHESEIAVVIKEAPSYSGFGSRPMVLRTSYPTDTKKATLIHELGHRLQNHFFRKEDEDHPYLFLYLYDVWTTLYGNEFADAQVAVESRRKGYYDYEGAWKEALALTAAERLARWQAFVASQDQQ